MKNTPRLKVQHMCEMNFSFSHFDNHYWGISWWMQGLRDLVVAWRFLNIFSWYGYRENPPERSTNEQELLEKSHLSVCHLTAKYHNSQAKLFWQLMKGKKLGAATNCTAIFHIMMYVSCESRKKENKPNILNPRKSHLRLKWNQVNKLQSDEFQMGRKLFRIHTAL